MLPNWLYGKSKSKLASILGGGGGTPADYDEVKAQVTQNAEDIALLDTSSQALISAFVNNINENGCKNICPYELTNYNIAGITITDSADGNYKILNGTCTGNPLIISLLDEITPYPIDFMNFSNVTKVTPKQLGIDVTKRYVFSRQSYDNVRFSIYLLNADGTLSKEIALGTSPSVNSIEVDFSAYTFDKMFICAKLAKDVVVSNYALKPMLCLKSDWDLDQTYVPYAMTNQELTKKLTADGNFGTVVSLSTYTAYSNMYTAPSDGYVHFQSAPSGSTARTIYTYGNNTTAATDPHFTHSTSANNKAFEIYIRKGLKIYADGLQSGDTINFYPLT